MAPTNKWTPDAERDLAMAILLSHGNIKHDWQSVEQKMTSWGYSFTMGSMSQHWTKKILKDFKARRAEGDNASEKPQAPVSTKKVTKPSSKASGGKRKLKRGEADGSDEDNNTPSKKRAVKKEDNSEAQARERSATDSEDKLYDEMLEGI